MVVLLWGESAFLLREDALSRFGETRPAEVDAAEWRPGLTADLATPSLLGEPRGLLVTGAQELPDDGLEEVAGYALEPSPDARVILTAQVSSRARGAPARLAKMLQGRARIERVAVERKDLPRWVRSRAEGRGLRASPPGVNALIQTVGEDPALLDQAVVQLADAFGEEGITPTTVSAQFRGFGERRIWELCDAAFGGDGRLALRHLRAMLEAREEPLAILGGIAARLRDLLRVHGLPPRMPPAELAQAAGLRFDWQARRYREQALRYSEEGLTDLHGRVAEADRMLKLGAQGDVVLPLLVATIAGAARG